MNLRDMDLEYLITARGDDVLRYQDKADMSDSEAERRMWRDEARRAAADVSRLVALRSPERVKAMEAEKGLV